MQPASTSAFFVIVSEDWRTKIEKVLSMTTSNVLGHELQRNKTA
jgi:hypothetical protein